MPEPLIPIPLPYGLKHDELDFEPGENETMDNNMGWLVDHVSWGDEGAMERIFRSTVILHQVHPDEPLGKCLHTAIVWECG